MFWDSARQFEKRHFVQVQQFYGLNILKRKIHYFGAGGFCAIGIFTPFFLFVFFSFECHSLRLHLKAVIASPYAFRMHSVAPPPFFGFVGCVKCVVHSTNHPTNHLCSLMSNNNGKKYEMQTQRMHNAHCTLHIHTLKASILYAHKAHLMWKEPAKNRNHVSLCYRAKRDLTTNATTLQRLHQLENTQTSEKENNKKRYTIHDGYKLKENWKSMHLT